MGQVLRIVLASIVGIGLVEFSRDKYNKAALEDPQEIQLIEKKAPSRKSL